MASDTDNTPEIAWNYFRGGDLAKAEAVSVKLIRVGGAFDELPLAAIWTIKAYFTMRCGLYEQARTLVNRVLGVYPEDRFAQEMLLLLDDETWRAADRCRLRTASNKDPMPGMLVLGIGTGRCGSTTLSALLNAQWSTNVSHEQVPLLFWDRITNADDFHVRRFCAIAKRFAVYGDVAHWWLPRIDSIIHVFPSVKIIALKRDKGATVDSFLKIKGGEGRGAINHWTDHDGRFWSKNVWDRCYPKYRCYSLTDCLSAFWDAYYGEVSKLMDKYPGSIREFSTETLSQIETQRSILSFIGYGEQDQVTLPDLHRNRGKIGD